MALPAGFLGSDLFALLVTFDVSLWELDLNGLKQDIALPLNTTLQYTVISMAVKKFVFYILLKTL